MLPYEDIVWNYIFIVVAHFSMCIVCRMTIKGNKEDTQYTKNVKLNKITKLLLGIPFYKQDKVEMEFVITQVSTYILGAVFAIASLYIVLQPMIIGFCYVGSLIIGIAGCLIYRDKKGDFKESKEHYE